MKLYRKILVPVDGSATSVRGLREAARLAKSQNATVVLMHVVDEFMAYSNPEAAYFAADVAKAMLADGRRVLAKAKAQAQALGVKAKAVLLERVGGPAANAIVREAKREGCDLIVIGTHGRRGVRRLVLGSDAELVVRNSPVPVLLVRAKG